MEKLIIIAAITAGAYFAAAHFSGKHKHHGHGRRNRFPHVHQWPQMLDGGNRQGPYYVGPGRS